MEIASNPELLIVGNPRRRRKRRNPRRRTQRKIRYGGKLVSRAKLSKMIGKVKARKVWHRHVGGKKRMK